MHGKEESFQVDVEMKVEELLVHRSKRGQLREAGISKNYVDLWAHRITDDLSHRVFISQNYAPRTAQDTNVQFAFQSNRVGAITALDIAWVSDLATHGSQKMCDVLPQSRPYSLTCRRRDAISTIVFLDALWPALRPLLLIGAIDHINQPGRGSIILVASDCSGRGTGALFDIR